MSVITLSFFIFTQLVTPSVFAQTVKQLPREVNVAPSFQLSIPEELGSIDELLTGNGPTIIHIQTAHGNYGVQKKIQAILHHLKNQYGIKLLLLEGSSEKLRPELLDLFPKDHALTMDIADRLAKKSLVKGAELFLLEARDANGYGIEDVSAYVENGRAFKLVLSEREKSQEFLKDLDIQIKSLASSYLNKSLREFLTQLESYENQIIPLAHWIGILKEEAKKNLELDLSNPIFQLKWPMLVRYFVLERLESKLDLEALKAEQIAFSKQIKPFVSPSLFEEVDGLLSEPLSRHHLSDPETTQLFEKLVSSLPSNFDFFHYQNVVALMGHLIVQSELKGDLLMNEVDRLSSQLADKFAATENEKEISKALRDYRLLTRLFALELSPEDYAQILGKRSSLNPKNLIRRFQEINSKKRVRDLNFKHVEEIESLFNHAFEFYRGTKERDSKMLRKMEARLKETGEKRAVVITGGFHADAFKNYFEQKGFNYALISPKVETFDGRADYVNLILQNSLRPVSIVGSTYERASLIEQPATLAAEDVNPLLSPLQLASALIEAHGGRQLSSVELEALKHANLVQAIPGSTNVTTTDNGTTLIQFGAEPNGAFLAEASITSNGAIDYDANQLSQAALALFPEAARAASVRSELRDSATITPWKGQFENLKYFAVEDIAELFLILKEAQAKGAYVDTDKTIKTTADFLAQLLWYVKLNDQRIAGEERLNLEEIQGLLYNKVSPLVKYFHQNPEKQGILDKYRQALEDYKNLPVRAIEFIDESQYPHVIVDLDPLDGTSNYDKGGTQYGTIVKFSIWNAKKKKYVPWKQIVYSPEDTLEFVNTSGKEVKIKGPLMEVDFEAGPEVKLYATVAPGQLDLIDPNFVRPKINADKIAATVRFSASGGPNPHLAIILEKYKDRFELVDDWDVGGLAKFTVAAFATVKNGQKIKLGVGSGVMQIWDLFLAIWAAYGTKAIVYRTGVKDVKTKVKDSRYGELVDGFHPDDYVGAQEKKFPALIVFEGDQWTDGLTTTQVAEDLFKEAHWVDFSTSTKKGEVLVATLSESGLIRISDGKKGNIFEKIQITDWANTTTNNIAGINFSADNTTISVSFTNGREAATFNVPEAALAILRAEARFTELSSEQIDGIAASPLNIRAFSPDGQFYASTFRVDAASDEDDIVQPGQNFVQIWQDGVPLENVLIDGAIGSLSFSDNATGLIVSTSDASRVAQEIKLPVTPRAELRNDEIYNAVANGAKDVALVESAISTSNPGEGLVYYGYPTELLLKEGISYEEVAFLLLNKGKLPNQVQLNEVKQSLDQYRVLHPNVKRYIRRASKEVSMTRVLQAALLIASEEDPIGRTNNSIEANRKRALWFIAQTASIIAARARVLKGEQTIFIKPKKGLSHAAQLLYQTIGRVPSELESSIFNKTLILYAEHMMNASTTSLRVIRSTRAHALEGVLGAIGALSGELHGGANTAVMRRLLQFRQEGGIEAAKKYLDQVFAHNEDVKKRIAQAETDDLSKEEIDKIREEKIILEGFGHRLPHYSKQGDARAQLLEVLLREFAKTKGAEGAEWMQLYDYVKERMIREKGMHPNVDYPIALIYFLLDLPLEMYVTIFEAARLAGQGAHGIEQQQADKLIRPQHIDVGPPIKNRVEPVSERGELRLGKITPLSVDVLRKPESIQRGIEWLEKNEYIYGNKFGYDIRITDVHEDSEGAQMGAYVLGRVLGGADYLNHKGRALVTGDQRFSSDALRFAYIYGLVNEGISVTTQADGQVITTGLTSRLGMVEGFDLTTQVTGSHNPPQSNGTKIVINNFPLFGEALMKLSAAAQNLSGVSEANRQGLLTKDSELINRHIQGLNQALPNLGDNAPNLIADYRGGAAGTVFTPLAQLKGYEVIELDSVEAALPDEIFNSQKPVLVTLNATPSPEMKYGYWDPSKAAAFANVTRLQERIKTDARFRGKQYLAGVFDGDGDRSGVQGETGTEIPPDRELITFYKNMIDSNLDGIRALNRLGHTVKLALDVRSSEVVIDVIEGTKTTFNIQDEGEFMAAGYPNHKDFVREELTAIEQLLEANRGSLSEQEIRAIEKLMFEYTTAEASGHFFFNTLPQSLYFQTKNIVDDGIASTIVYLHILEKTGQTAQAANDSFLKLPVTREVRLENAPNDVVLKQQLAEEATLKFVENNPELSVIPLDQLKTKVEAARNNPPKRQGAKESLLLVDGVRIKLTNGVWILLRKSNSSPVIVFKAEADELTHEKKQALIKTTEALRDAIEEVVQSNKLFEGLDISGLNHEITRLETLNRTEIRTENAAEAQATPETQIDPASIRLSRVLNTGLAPVGATTTEAAQFLNTVNVGQAATYTATGDVIISSAQVVSPFVSKESPVAQLMNRLTVLRDVLTQKSPSANTKYASVSYLSEVGNDLSNFDVTLLAAAHQPNQQFRILVPSSNLGAESLHEQVLVHARNELGLNLETLHNLQFVGSYGTMNPSAVQDEAMSLKLFLTAMDSTLKSLQGYTIGFVSSNSTFLGELQKQQGLYCVLADDPNLQSAASIMLTKLLQTIPDGLNFWQILSTAQLFNLFGQGEAAKLLADIAALRAVEFSA